jgi:IclR family KDG regulon transcriptional repressor
MKQAYHSSTIQRALDILNLFKEQGNLSFNDIQRTVGFNKTTLYRVLSTLLDNQYLKKGEKGSYELGLNLFILGNRISKEHLLINVSTPHMKDLSQRFGLAAHLGILEGREVIILQKSDPDRLIKMVCNVGGSVPAHCTSQGKVLLAYAPKDTVQKVIDIHGLPRYTPHSICTTEGLMAELEKVRTQGWSLDNAEHEKNIRCVAVPIFNESGKIEAALSSAGTTVDLPDDEAIKKTVEILKEVRDKIRFEMGYGNHSNPGSQE